MTSLRTQLEELAGKAKRLGYRDPQWIHSVVDFKALCWRNRETILSALEAVEWRPIETAPRDGTVILCYRPDAGLFTAHYVEDDAHLSSAEYPPEGDCYWFTTGGEDLTDDMPTHWRPLGPTPTEGNSPVPQECAQPHSENNHD